MILLSCLFQKYLLVCFALILSVQGKSSSSLQSEHQHQHHQHQHHHHLRQLEEESSQLFSLLFRRRKFCVPDGTGSYVTKNVFFVRAAWLYYSSRRRYSDNDDNKSSATMMMEGPCEEEKCAQLCEQHNNNIPCRVYYAFSQDTESCICKGDDSTPVECGVNAACSDTVNACVCKEGYTGDALSGCIMMTATEPATTSPTTTTARRRLESNTELRAAVQDYLGANTYASKFYGSKIGDWDVSMVTNLTNIFDQQMTFNEPGLDQWDVSHATTMSGMFRNASSYAAQDDLSKWNVSQVTDMSYMFQGASKFISDLSKWDVSNVQNFMYMFDQATFYTRDLCAWGPKLIVQPSQPQQDRRVTDMFAGTHCPNPADPDLTSSSDDGGIIPGPFCHPCSCPTTGFKLCNGQCIDEQTCCLTTEGRPCSDGTCENNPPNFGCCLEHQCGDDDNNNKKCCNPDYDEVCCNGKCSPYYCCDDPNPCCGLHNIIPCGDNECCDPETQVCCNVTSSCSSVEACNNHTDFLGT